jgi:hypothetical protein
LSFAPQNAALGQAAEPPRYAAQRTVSAAPLSVFFGFVSSAGGLWQDRGNIRAGRRGFKPARLSCHRCTIGKIYLNQKSRRANSSGTPILSV